MSKTFENMLVPPGLVGFAARGEDPTGFLTLLFASLFAGSVLALFVQHNWHLKREAGFFRERARLHHRLHRLGEKAASGERFEARGEASSGFLASLCHEVRTPLSGILGMVELLLGTRLDQEQKIYVETLHEAGTALLRLIDGMLDLSKIEAGRLELVEEPFDLVMLLESTVALFAPRAQEKGLDIASTIAADVPLHLMGDAARLRQVLLNLTENAVKFTERGAIGLRVVRESEKIIQIDVLDTGPGVPLDRREAIFEAYEQADASIRMRYGGSGLGLSICKRIVEAMNGTISLATPEREGSVFSIRLPLRPWQTGRDTRFDLPNLSGRHAMIVAAAPLTASYLGARLREAGAEVHLVETEEAATARLGINGTEWPDLFFVDGALGEAATRRLGEAARIAGVNRRIALVSLFEQRSFGQDFAHGFDACLVKPVRHRSLLGCLGGPAELTALAIPPSVEAIAPYMDTREVLVAEDDDINAMLVTRHLEKLAMRVTRARDGETTVALVERAFAGAGPGFDLIFIDIRMPRMGGYEVARRIRQAERSAGRARTRLIALTASASHEDRMTAHAVGFDEFLAKPLDRVRMREILRVDQDARDPGSLGDLVGALPDPTERYERNGFAPYR